MLQPAASILDTDEVFGAFSSLCLSTEADLALATVAARGAGLESYDFRVPMRRDVLKLMRRASFRKLGYFLTVEHFEVRELGKLAGILNVARLLAGPADFRGLQDRFVEKFGQPNMRDLAGIGVSFASIAGSTEDCESYDVAYQRHLAGAGDLVVIDLGSVEAYGASPSETTSMGYSRWI